MKKALVIAVAVAVALTAGVSAYAANPFSDVTPDDWAYQAISDLSDQGVVEGYPDGTFKGERNMTRYELAQIIARLMAREDQLNSKQRATLDKLSSEYADELANLGVRVSNLEKKVGNISWSGDSRMRWQNTSVLKGQKDTDKFNGRVRIKALGRVNDRTYAFARIDSTDVDFKSGNDGNAVMDRLFVHHDLGSSVGVTIGRYNLALGNKSFLYDNDFDGIEAVWNANKQVNFTAGYGRFKKFDKTKHPLDESFYAKANANLSFAKLGIEYFKVHHDNQEIFGGMLTIPISGSLYVYGDYYENLDADKGTPKAWSAGLGFDNFNASRPGTFKLNVGHYDIEKGVYNGGSTFQTNAIYHAIDEDLTFWNAFGEFTIAKNVYIHAEYAFDINGENGNDYEDAMTLSLNYNF